jgi:hypothetical protein
MPPPAPSEVEAFIGQVVTDLSATFSGVLVNEGRTCSSMPLPLSAIVRSTSAGSRPRGLPGVTANTFSVNTKLSVLTMAGAALGQTPASKSASTATVATPS